MSSSPRPARLSALINMPCEEVPRPTATFLPFRSSTLLMSEPSGTRTESEWESRSTTAATILKSASAAAPKIGGVLPTHATSIWSAEAASTIGGPAVNSDHSIS